MITGKKTVQILASSPLAKRIVRNSRGNLSGLASATAAKNRASEFPHSHQGGTKNFKNGEIKTPFSGISILEGAKI
ncbi:MAG: hypothetical protein JSR44_10390 [Spirochaetes bacterium]|nr:hypothetical protein [Spirochaetota bacterium]